MGRILGHPTLKTATYAWPGFLPSPSLTPLLRSEVSLLAAEKNRLKVVLFSYIGGGFSLGTCELIEYLFSSVAGRTLIVLLGIWMLKLLS